ERDADAAAAKADETGFTPSSDERREQALHKEQIEKVSEDDADREEAEYKTNGPEAEATPKKADETGFTPSSDERRDQALHKEQIKKVSEDDADREEAAHQTYGREADAAAKKADETGFTPSSDERRDQALHKEQIEKVSEDPDKEETEHEINGPEA